MPLHSNERYCSGCGEPISADAVWCPNCGLEPGKSTDTDGPSMAYCQSCGGKVHRAAELCPHCGVGQSGAGTSSTGSSDEEAGTGQALLAAFLILIGIGALTDGGSIVGSLVVGGGFIAAGLMLVPSARDRLLSLSSSLRERDLKRHSLSTVGWTPTVREERVTNPDATCSNCYDEIDVGVRRAYGKDFAVGGVVVREQTDGENYYCDSCQRVEESVETAMAVETEV